MVVGNSIAANSSLNESQTGPAFKMPNPGDVFILSAFGWAALCFFMVTAGNQLFQQLARLSASRAIRDIVTANQSAIALIMLVGIILIALGCFMLARYPRVLFGFLFLGQTFAGASWPTLHDPAFGMRYLVIIYLAIFGGIFFLQNFWKMIVTPYIRVVILYLAWIALVVLINGVKLRDFWYLATEFTLMVGLGYAWISRVNNYERLIEFNKLLAYVAIPITILCALSPLFNDNAIAGGRFQAFSDKPTGFAIVYSLALVPLFWLSMYEKRKLVRQLATVLALVGFALILLSGTRNGTVASLMGIGCLWWVFRTRIFVYMIALAILALLVQILFSGDENIAFVSSRLASTENTRLEVWALYTNLAAQSPFVGYGYDGLRGAVYGQNFIDAFAKYGFINAPGAHNFYLGIAVRFGIPALILSCCILYLSMRTSWQVVFSNIVSERDKQAYILPAAMVAVVAAEGLFEDTMGSTGKGSLHGVVLATCAYISVVYGRRLLKEAEQKASLADEQNPVRKLVRK
jgi:O-antigen ligase